MPIILTLHVFGLTVTIRVKSKTATRQSDGFVDIVSCHNHKPNRAEPLVAAPFLCFHGNS